MANKLVQGLLTSAFAAAALLCSAQAAEWRYHEIDDPFIDDGKTAVATVMGEAFSATYGPSYIKFRCNPKKEFDVIISLAEYIGSNTDNEVNWQYRFDKLPTIHTFGPGATDGRFFFSHKDRADLFARAASVSKTVAIRAYSYKGDQYTLVFDLDGQNGEIKKVRAICGLSNEYSVEELQAEVRDRGTIDERDVVAAKGKCITLLRDKGFDPYDPRFSGPKTSTSEKGHVITMGNVYHAKRKSFNTYMCIIQDGLLRSLTIL